MQPLRISFIGGGNMARSLVGGLIADGVEARHIAAADPDESQRAALSQRYGIRTEQDNAAAADGADVVVLAVKPHILRQVTEELAPTLRRADPLVISIAAGIREPDLSRWVGGDPAVVRAMPNTPALIGSGITGLYANERVSTERRDVAETILRAAGAVVWLDDEALIDAVTALSGSGPAYFFLVMEAMEQAGVELGLTRETARLLTIETAVGAARMALESDEDPATLRRQVTSPGGTTAAALDVLENEKLRESFALALRAARDRGAELAGQYGGT